jgi:hypothetical protein
MNRALIPKEISLNWRNFLLFKEIFKEIQFKAILRNFYLNNKSFYQKKLAQKIAEQATIQNLQLNDFKQWLVLTHS